MAISQINSNSLASGVPASSNMPTGSVIQTVNYSTTSAAVYASTSNNSFTTTGFGVSITPQFSNSKILVTVCANGGTAASGSAYWTIYRNNSTNLATGTAPSALSSTRNNLSGASPILPLSMMFLDSPATTSSTTYTVYQFTNAGGNSVYFGAPNSDLQSIALSITAQEIKV
jgi:hypothetical protein